MSCWESIEDSRNENVMSMNEAEPGQYIWIAPVDHERLWVAPVPRYQASLGLHSRWRGRLVMALVSLTHVVQVMPYSLACS